MISRQVGIVRFKFSFFRRRGGGGGIGVLNLRIFNPSHHGQYNFFNYDCQLIRMPYGEEDSRFQVLLNANNMLMHEVEDVFT